ncbi:MAG: SIS domain-containing protein [Solirubrobacterales bacterium]|nr:SIS domain-containing protein [Solirubrobacterales bacterium]MBV9685028.1 SIS domain-containing protein [Solirubrobacterales bacterium]
MSAEMAEQPERLRDLIARTDEVEAVVQALAPRPLRGVTLVARGSSDHAAVYGRYLLEQATGKPISLAAPSLHTLYGVRGDYEGQLAVAISQSGRTPEIVTTLSRLCAAGARGLAITNDATSEIARMARGVLELGVGEERAVPATKTVTAQFVAFAQIAHALGDTPFSRDELETVPSWVQQVLDDPQPAEAAAEMLVDAAHLIVVARGFLYAAALETALKIKETCSILADGYSSADLRHGPIAAVTRDFPVIAISAPGPAADDVLDLVVELRRRGARPLLISPDEEADVALPQGMPETLAPIVAVVRGQQVARALALALELDPDNPPGLSKVTVT